MTDEQLQAVSGLEQKLQPVLESIQKEALPQDKYQTAQDWFEVHEENLAASATELFYLCRLPDEDRRLLTYPVIGNWFLDKISAFKATTPHQEQAYQALRQMVKETRFCNSHLERYYQDPYGYQRRLDEFNSLLLASPDESMPLHYLLENIGNKIAEAVYNQRLPRGENYSSDLGHGLVAPSREFCFLTWYLNTLREKNLAQPLDKTIMIVDDEQAQNWYQRMIAVGFKDQSGQPGYFADCETALAALKKGHYDVILSDLNLGPGKMNGAEFAKKAYRIQRSKGITPLISVFSDDREALKAVEEKLFYGKHRILFHQVHIDNLKSGFSAIHFRNLVSGKIKYG